MDRRNFISTAAATPLVALSVGTGGLHAEPETKILRLYRGWADLTERYNSRDRAWKDKEITSKQFEDSVNPILDKRDAIEHEICNADCAHISDLLIIIQIAAYFDWNVECYNKAVATAAQLGMAA